MSSDTGDFIARVAFFTSLAGASILLGYSSAVSKLRKSTPDNPDAKLYEQGAALARKALMRGTIYSVCGFGVFAFASYKLFGKKMIDDFNSRAKKNDEEDIKYLQNLFGTSVSTLVGDRNNSSDDKSEQIDK